MLATPQPNDTRGCRGPGRDNPDLINAHIVPRSFGRLIQYQTSANVTLTMDSATQKNPLGVFDSGILCSTCDGFLNHRYDKPALELFKELKLSRGDLNMRRHGLPSQV